MKGVIIYKQRANGSFPAVTKEIVYNGWWQWLKAVIKANISGADEIIYNDSGLRHLGQVNLPAGHTMYELDLSDYRIREAQYTAVAVIAGGESSKKIVIRPKCLYATALNKPNADKKFHKMLGVKYHKK